MDIPSRTIDPDPRALSGFGAADATATLDGGCTRPESALVRRLRARVAQRLTEQVHTDEHAGLPPMSAQQRRELARAMVTDAFAAYEREASTSGQDLPPGVAKERVIKAVYDSLFEVTGFQPYLDDPKVENIHVNGADWVWVRYADGRSERVDRIAASDAELLRLVRELAADAGAMAKGFDRRSPALSCVLPDGSLMFAVMAVTDRPSVTIRCRHHVHPTLDGLVESGTLDRELSECIRSLVLSRGNIVVCGGARDGKTTFLRALAAEIPATERLVVIEESPELLLDRNRALHPNLVAMHAWAADVEGASEVGLPALVDWGLRMDPDRLIVGEVRGAELVPICGATGHGNGGWMTTVQATCASAALRKLSLCMMGPPERLSLDAANLLVASAVDVVIQLGRDEQDRRVVSGVDEVVDADERQIVSRSVYRRG